MRGTHAERLLESVFAQFFHSPLSFGNDYTFSAEQIYYRWFSLVPSRDLGKLPHMCFFHTLLLLLNSVYVHCQTSHCVRTKEAKAIMGWAKGRSEQKRQMEPEKQERSDVKTNPSDCLRSSGLNPTANFPHIPWDSHQLSHSHGKPDPADILCLRAGKLD